jgi:hypothetical protein
VERPPGGDSLGADGTTAEDPLEAHFAARQRLLLDQFSRWLDASPGREGGAHLAGQLLEQVAADTLNDLLAAAGRLPDDDVPSWVRQQFDSVIGAFGMALRASIPDNQRHQAAQVLQLKMLEAERMLADGLDRWSRGA